MQTKRNLRETLLFCFHLKKSFAVESQRMLLEAYGDYTPSISTCEYWFRCYKKGDFDTEDKECPGQPKKFEDEEIEVLLDQDLSQTQAELAEFLNIDRATISRRLKVAIEMIQKQGNWVPYELKPKDVKRRKMACELLLQRQRKKSFLYRIVTSDEKWILYDKPKRKKSWYRSGKLSTSTAKPSIHGAKLMLCI